MDTFLPVAATVSLVVAIINFVKYIKVGNWNGVITQLAVWVAGVIVIFLAAQTTWAEDIGKGVFGKSLADMDGWSLLFLGLCVGGLAIVTNEFKKALDAGDSAQKPPLVDPTLKPVRKARTKKVVDG